MILHFIANHHERYLRYALIAIHSYITRGQVPRQNIVLTTCAKWEMHQVVSILRGYGITVRLKDEVLGKFIEMGDLFDNQLDYGKIIQIDVDTILCHECDFISDCKQMIDGTGLGCYLQPNPDPVRVQHGRIIPDLVNHRFIWFNDSGYRRFDCMLDALFGFTIADYREWLHRQNHWWFGGVIIVDRRHIRAQLWKSMVAMNTIVHCDETVMAMAIMRNEMEFYPLLDSIMPHVVNPKCGICEYLNDSTRGHNRGILHYAGDWYREKDTANRNTIDALYNSLVN